MDPDRQLVERFRGGDAAAFDEIVTRHRRPVYLMALRLLGRHEDADEAAQEAFVRAWRALPGFRGDAALRTWLVRIVLNVAKTMHARRPPETAVGRAGDEDATAPLDAQVAPVAPLELERSESGRRVRRAVAGLPPRQREAVVLKVFGEMTYREAAAAMGVSEGSVKAHLHQAVANLRKRMAAVGVA